MAKVSMVEREKRRARTRRRYSNKKALLKAQKQELRKSWHDGTWTLEAAMEWQKKSTDVPVDASPSRRRNRCKVTGRPRSYYRRFGLCRNFLRDLGSDGKIPGLVKSSW